MVLLCAATSPSDLSFGENQWSSSYAVPTVTEGWQETIAEGGLQFSQAVTEVGFSMHIVKNTTDLWDNNYFVFRDAAGNDVLQVTYHASNTLKVMLRDGSGVMQQIGSTFPIPYGDTTARRYEIHFRLHASTGRVEIRIAGNTVFEYDGPTDLGDVTGALTRCAVRLFSVSWVIGSAMFCVDDVPWPYSLYQNRPSGAGTLSEWTGDYTAIDEAGYSDADYLEATSADLEHSWTKGAFSLSGYTIEGVVVACRAKSDSADSIDAIAVVNGVAYTSASGPQALTSTFAPRFFHFPVNPATGAKWQLSELNDAELGVKSL